MEKSFFEKNRGGIIALLVVIGIAAFAYHWRTGVEQVPGDYEVKKGNYRLEDGQLEQAMKEFDDALARNPDNQGAHLGLAVTNMQMGNNDEALKHFDRLIELDPGSAVAYADRGILLDRMGRYELALQDYKKAIYLEPRIAEGPGWLWRFMRNIDERPPTIVDRAKYLEAELAKPPEERLLQMPEIDEKQRMYTK